MKAAWKPKEKRRKWTLVKIANGRDRLSFRVAFTPTIELFNELKEYFKHKYRLCGVKITNQEENRQ